MSEVEMYWQAIATKAGDNRKWTELSPQDQHLIINSINQLLHVLRNKP